MKKKQLVSICLAATLALSTFSGSVDAASVQYKVKKGDSLWKISVANHVSVSKLKEWNKLKSNVIRVGQNLYIAKPNTSAKKTSTNVKTSKYKVKKGDTLSKIAKQYNTTVKEIKAANKLKNDMIKIGQLLSIPKKTTSSKAAVKPVASTKSNSSKTAVKPVASTNNKTESNINTKVVNNNASKIESNQKDQEKKAVENKSQYATIHTVQSGEYLYLIALKYGTSVSEIKRLNGLTSDMIYVGQKLKVTEGIIKPPAAPAFLKDGKFPLEKGKYFPFGDSWNASRTYGGDRVHEGIDIMAPMGTPIYSVTNGVITNFGWNELGGWRVSIATSEGYYLYYAHMSKYAPKMAKGVTVKKGQLIGYVGNTGYGPSGTSGKFDTHLHFGMYDKNWAAMNPFNHLKYWEALDK
ncbi:LysM peptidoglycan-binding domain-containing protein [Lederbergia panacisoli]|uniref:LysM peptidoglycan-binding domain-containing protein n=1 Tax=Lederbergia panacisoli TaxID=1255251 RepID=UPI00214B04AA|nr:LysM peptidoglycan-binding domain-containing protein [Lederbergia panacisoli]MCR2822047.1 LysM peptidoglycan-binding domain-containing protein [Lederbergia panacisoli]